MNRVVERREDKYSPSLHLIDEADGTRFSDDDRTLPKGDIMAAGKGRDSAISPARVKAVRQARHKAVVHRRVLVLALLIVTAVVLGAAIGFKFSPLFALIPVVLLAVVLYFGVRASKQAQAWERKLRQMRRQSAKSGHPKGGAPKAQVSESVQRGGTAQSANVPQTVASRTGSAQAVAAAEAPTDVMREAEIRSIIEKTVLKTSSKSSAKTAAKSVNARQSAKSAGSSRSVAAAKPAEPSEQTETAAKAKAEEHKSAKQNASAQSAQDRAESVPAEVVKHNEVKQDLISFSLGEVHETARKSAARGKSNATVNAEPQSLEIKSTRQVAVATPKTKAELAAEAKVEAKAKNEAGMKDESKSAKKQTKSSGSASAKLTAKSEQSTAKSAEDFHSSEQIAEVEVPEASSDSLGEGLEAILVRRQG